MVTASNPTEGVNMISRIAILYYLKYPILKKYKACKETEKHDLYTVEGGGFVSRNLDIWLVEDF